jgi:hypothetical protein
MSIFGFLHKLRFVPTKPRVYGAAAPGQADVHYDVHIWVVFSSPKTPGQVDIQALPDDEEGQQRLAEIRAGCDVIAVIRGTQMGDGIGV